MVRKEKNRINFSFFILPDHPAILLFFFTKVDNINLIIFTEAHVPL
jgi:hypothetical protein